MTEDGEALRRRLYRPGAAEADVDAYLTAAASEPQVRGAPPAARQRRRAPSRSAVAVGLALAVVVAASVLVLQAVRAGPPSAAGPARLPALAVSPATAARFEAALERGDDAGLGPWWTSTSPYIEEHGTGDGTIELPLSDSAGGRLTVLLVLAQDGTAGWTASRLDIRSDRTIHLQTEAGDFGALSAGVPAIGRIDSTALRRPLQLFVQAPVGTRWGVAAVITG